MSDLKRYWVPNGTLADQSGWHQDDTCVVQDWAYDAALAREAALQARLTVAHQRLDDAADLMRRALAVIEGKGWEDLERDIAAYLKGGDL